MPAGRGRAGGGRTDHRSHQLEYRGGGARDTSTTCGWPSGSRSWWVRLPRRRRAAHRRALESPAPAAGWRSSVESARFTRDRSLVRNQPRPSSALVANQRRRSPSRLASGSKPAAPIQCAGCGTSDVARRPGSRPVRNQPRPSSALVANQRRRSPSRLASGSKPAAPIQCAGCEPATSLAVPARVRFETSRAHPVRWLRTSDVARRPGSRPVRNQPRPCSQPSCGRSGRKMRLPQRGT